MVMAAVREDPGLPDEVRLLPAHLLVHLNALETRPEMLQYGGHDANCDALLGAHPSSWLATTPEFEEEGRLAEEEMQHWERYVSAFRAMHGHTLNASTSHNGILDLKIGYAGLVDTQFLTSLILLGTTLRKTP
eukprot:6212395-Pleurochrysis_carterae.AAC.6